MRRLLVFAFLLPFALAAQHTHAPKIGVEQIPAPAAKDASGAAITMSPEGVAWLTWTEKTAAGHALRLATFDANAKRWSEPRPISQGANWFVNWADFPALTVGPNGNATAVWFVNNPASAAAVPAHDHHGPGYHALIARSSDGGKTWSRPLPLTRESDSVEFVALATLADGRVLAAWLDGRAKKKGGKAQQLFARILGSETPDTLVDDSVCDCCQTTLTAFPDGTALLAYRARREHEVRDIHLTRFRGREWDEPRSLNSDDWRIAGCPVNGPQLASDGGRVAVSWFTAADNDPRVLASISPDAGARFLMPVKINHVKPAGRVATTLLHDGAMLITWVDVDGAVWLRRVSPDFSPNESVQLEGPHNGRTKGFPRAALLRDYTGGDTPAQMLVAYARDGGGLRTQLVTVPERALVEAEQNCDCAPSVDQMRGYPIRGTILEAPAGTHTVRVKHFEVPGIFTAAEREFYVEPSVHTALGAGRQFLGRIEKRDGAWWLFEVRLIATAPR